MKQFIWKIIEACVAVVLALIMIGLVHGVSEHFNGFFRGVLACVIAYWFVGKVKEK